MTPCVTRAQRGMQDMGAVLAHAEGTVPHTLDQLPNLRESKLISQHKLAGLVH